MNTKARGSSYRRDQLKTLPFVVEAKQAPGGLGQRLSDMMAWCSERVGQDGYATSFREDCDTSTGPMRIGYVIWHFADEQAAKYFAAHFELTDPTANGSP
jgi:hypothetical protein